MLVRIAISILTHLSSLVVNDDIDERENGYLQVGRVLPVLETPDQVNHQTLQCKVGLYNLVITSVSQKLCSPTKYAKLTATLEHLVMITH